MTVKLYDYWRSSAAYRVRIALNLKGVAYESVTVDLIAGDQNTDQHRAVSPQGRIPALEIDGLVLTQSLAIIDYLDANYADPPMVSSDPATRSQQLAMALVIAADIHPLNNLSALGQLESRFGADAEAKKDWMGHWISEGLTALEAMADPDQQFLCGYSPGIADVCLVPQLYNARRFSVPLDAYPTLTRIEAACLALPAFANAAPDAVKGE
jgi:maleylacetoacetate isomerase